MVNKYSYEQVLEASLKYFNGDDLAAKVFADKYALQDTDGKYDELTPDDMHKRLAKEFARIEQKYPNPMSEEEIYGLLKGFKYIVPQGSPMFGIGNNYFIQSLGNCFVINSPHDSYGGICKSDQELVQLMKRRAGVGLDLSNIRPKGMITNNAAKTTDGISVFMERFSNSCREVAQSGRRGALLQSISIEHPEVETFISIKRNLKKVTGANISVRLTDEFMNAVKNNKSFKLRWPIGSKTPKIEKTVDAKELWNKLIENAWTSAEPGIFFWDTVIKNSPADVYGEKDKSFKTQSSNPCQPSWATILTPNGIKTFADISVGDIIWSGKSWTKIINKVNTGNKDVYAFKTRAGIFYGTENHRVVSNGEKIEVCNAENIDISTTMAFGETSKDTYIQQNTLQDILTYTSLDNKENNKFNQAVMDGIVLGDGTVHKASNNGIFLIIGDDDQDYFESEISDLILEYRPGVKEKCWDVKTTIDYKELPKTYNRVVPDRFKFGDFNTRRAFLRGLYTANGSVVSNRITLKASSFKVIEDVQIMLSSLGISSYYTTNKAKKVEFSNGIYECKENYDLNIGTIDGRKLFNKLIGFIQKNKTIKLNETLRDTNYGRTKTNYEIVEKQFISNEPVYDITVEADEHTYWTGGLLVSNCGEITMGVDSCRLLVVNLLNFVEDAFTKQSKFNFDHFAKVVIKAQRLMDDLIDLEIEKIEKIIAKIESDPEPEEIKSTELNLWKEFKRTCIAGRRTGLGITALGDTLAALNVKYGSKKSIDFADEIYKYLAVNAYKSSCIMSKERGAFPLYEYELEKNHQFISRVVSQDDELSELYKRYGRRNIALTTTAPTGSVSTLTQTSSGIEPVYLLSYVRRKKINPNDKDAKIDFVDDLGDKWQEFTVYHHGVKKWMEVTGESDITKSPYNGGTSNDVDWVASVDIQAAAQKWICHSISKTCNLPNSASKELVSDVYMRAWESGCKGFTVYRDGCRTGVLVSDETHKKQKQQDKDGRPFNMQQSFAPKRPQELFCDIKKAKIQGEQWTLLVGLLEGRPYEVFGGLSKFIDIPNKYKVGKIIKNGKVDGVSTYNLTIGDEDDAFIIKNIADVFDNPNNGSLTRSISLSLRHGIPIQFIVEQLQKDKYSDMTSFSKILARTLKSYIKDGTVSSEKVCPNCKKEGALIYQEGCISCSCGYAKCG